MRLGAIIPQGNFSANTWVKIYENELGSAETSITISNLDGNTDVMYRLIVRWVSNTSAGGTFYLYPNNDTTASNYGGQYIQGYSTSVAAIRENISLLKSLSFGPTAVGQLYLINLLLYAKSGYIRTSIENVSEKISTTTISLVGMTGNVWNNTVDNITSLVISFSEASGLGTGTAIELWKPLAKV